MAPTDESPRGGETRPRRNRRHRRRQRDDDETGVDAWLDATVYFGLGQHLLLALPMLWVAFMTVSTPVAVTTAAVVSLAVACLAIGALRLDAVSVGAPWHRIEDNEIGLGPDAGYGFLVRRAAYLNATLGLGTFLGARADLAGAGFLGSVVVAGGVALCAMLALPRLRAAPARTSAAAAGVYYAVSLLAVATFPGVAGLFSLSPSVALCVLAVAVAAAFDVATDRKRR
ncbi:hypothetical protein G3A49_05595 [Haloferax volcanii]|uniref:Uncharacterized protein n=3 Tax=Haloferax TaxID=2251 RepID=A0ACD5I1U5_9EURY|nr:MULTISPECIES: hypothetical protein [Haloferax]ELZ72569.1 hypothetical protein C456_13358 [Haloferax lucentense DSM 14919]QIB77636.1 hypothetical protein G3A49_05595 [Haloferax alexandrinus]RDZ30511.1 hypothetical protein DEQ67_13130 [Haloferax sp. Atlit-48N]